MTERKGTTRRRRRESGQVAIEYLGFIPLLLLVALLAIQLGVAAYTANQAGTAARAAARTASQDALDQELLPETAGRRAISEWLSDDLDLAHSSGTRDITYTATIEVPSVVPGMEGLWGAAKRSSTMPLD
ncbi:MULTISPECIES: TadE/TadG family type IV pilus assembly protein [unclassified Streptomyces]|uniref:TadE/TadG family type IV pilus assembly protein n=1 Tax=unclassified Streptomyces TaxID=2593676 RepID=UPI002E75A054|nr:TadE/TadG family type IV pilus assembly protein [Streptomyces sp. JV176]MEE1804234.1 TadE/TadG family type IV pilus assembly protein [Streptomyces sp. JV176]